MVVFRMPKSAKPASPQADLFSLIRAILRDEAPAVATLLQSAPSLARDSLAVSATRQIAAELYLEDIGHYLIAGDTPLHAAAAGCQTNNARALIEHGAAVTAQNRRGESPLHYAANGGRANLHMESSGAS
jgi:Ankyrin repeats (many copies)